MSTLAPTRTSTSSSEMMTLDDTTFVQPHPLNDHFQYLQILNLQENQHVTIVALNRPHKRNAIHSKVRACVHNTTKYIIHIILYIYLFHQHPFPWCTDQWIHHHVALLMRHTNNILVMERNWYCLFTIRVSWGWLSCYCPNWFGSSILCWHWCNGSKILWSHDEPY